MQFAAEIKSKIVKAFLEQISNANNGSARTVGIDLAASEQFAKFNYRKDTAI
jgi:hypothetical protein